MASAFKTSKAELVAIYRLEFYKKQKNWKFCSERKKKEERKAAKNAKAKLNQTYNIGPDPEKDTEPPEIDDVEKETDNQKEGVEGEVRLEEEEGKDLNEAFVDTESDEIIPPQTPPDPPNSPYSPKWSIQHWAAQCQTHQNTEPAPNEEPYSNQEHPIQSYPTQYDMETNQQFNFINSPICSGAQFGKDGKFVFVPYGDAYYDANEQLYRADEPLYGADVPNLVANSPHSGANLLHSDMNLPFTGATLPPFGAILPHSRMDLPQSRMDLPRCGAKFPYSGMDLPQYGVNLTNTDTNLPHCGVNFPYSGVDLPQSGVNLPQCPTLPRCGANLPFSGTDLPQSGVNLPQFGMDLPRPETNLLHSGTNLPQLGVNVPQFATDLPRSEANLPQCTDVPQQSNVLSVERLRGWQQWGGYEVHQKGWPAQSQVWTNRKNGGWGEGPVPVMADVPPEAAMTDVVDGGWTVVEQADEWLANPSSSQKSGLPRCDSLQSVSSGSFARGIARAPHSTEVDLQIPDSSTESLSETALAAAVARHTDALKALLDEARRRDKVSPSPVKQIYSFDEYPTRDIGPSPYRTVHNATTINDVIITGSFKNTPDLEGQTEVGRGRGRRVNIIGIGMGRPYRL